MNFALLSRLTSKQRMLSLMRGNSIPSARLEEYNGVSGQVGAAHTTRGLGFLSADLMYSPGDITPYDERDQSTMAMLTPGATYSPVAYSPPAPTDATLLPTLQNTAVETKTGSEGLTPLVNTINSGLPNYTVDPSLPMPGGIPDPLPVAVKDPERPAWASQFTPIDLSQPSKYRSVDDRSGIRQTVDMTQLTQQQMPDDLIGNWFSRIPLWVKLLGAAGLGFAAYKVIKK